MDCIYLNPFQGKRCFGKPIPILIWWRWWKRRWCVRTSGKSGNRGSESWWCWGGWVGRHVDTTSLFKSFLLLLLLLTYFEKITLRVFIVLARATLRVYCARLTGSWPTPPDFELRRAEQNEVLRLWFVCKYSIHLLLLCKYIYIGSCYKTPS